MTDTPKPSKKTKPAEDESERSATPKPTNPEKDKTVHGDEETVV